MLIRFNGGRGGLVECSLCSLRAANTVPDIQGFLDRSGSSTIKAVLFHKHQLCVTGIFLFPLVEMLPREWMLRGRCSHDTTAEKGRLWRLLVAAAGPTRPPTSSTVNIGDLKPGFVCAALYTSNGQPLWHRAVVKSVQARPVFMFYIDYGTIMSVKVADIKRIRIDFLDLPAEAIEAWLSGVNSKNEKKFTPEPKLRFLQLELVGECNFSVVSQEEDTFVVQLLTSDGNMEHSLSDVLIYEDLARSATSSGQPPCCRTSKAPPFRPLTPQIGWVAQIPDLRFRHLYSLLPRLHASDRVDAAPWLFERSRVWEGEHIWRLRKEQRQTDRACSANSLYRTSVTPAVRSVLMASDSGMGGTADGLAILSTRPFRELLSRKPGGALPTRTSSYNFRLFAV
ncbi:hypothetical protein HPB50_029019 [Hyalomma asiaticum]|nr:hypothetical protein HPB50_029019 [Hyalomma asiaticum]